jgi:lipopolysaccharide transport system ATP-binding protein
MSATAIRVHGLGKRYEIGAAQPKYRTLRDSLVSMARKSSQLLRPSRRRDPEHHSFWALKDLTLDIQAGEVVGIIGRNGAGKSTLLKILSRITEPTQGYAEVRGRIGSLLEVGTGFHPELTGRENIYLNGAILGMRHSEIDRKFDEIVAFSEVERFVDTPVKHYSSGMYLRLAFAVAAHLESEVLVVDEVLAVGDAAFQKRCLGKMGEVAEQGRTVLFVSHNMAAIDQLCQRAVLLSGGRLVRDGDCSSVISEYLSLGAEKGPCPVVEASQVEWRSGKGDGAKITKVELEDADGYPSACFAIGAPIRVNIHVNIPEQASNLIVGMEVKSASGVPLLNLRNDSQNVQFGPYNDPTEIVFTITLPGLPFYPGIYTLEPWVAKMGVRTDHWHNSIRIALESQGHYESERFIQDGRGVVLMDCKWEDQISVMS